MTLELRKLIFLRKLTIGQLQTSNQLSLATSSKPKKKQSMLSMKPIAKKSKNLLPSQSTKALQLRVTQRRLMMVKLIHHLDLLKLKVLFGLAKLKNTLLLMLSGYLLTPPMSKLWHSQRYQFKLEIKNVENWKVLFSITPGIESTVREESPSREMLRLHSLCHKLTNSPSQVSKSFLQKSRIKRPSELPFSQNRLHSQVRLVSDVNKIHPTHLMSSPRESDQHAMRVFAAEQPGQRAKSQKVTITTTIMSMTMRTILLLIRSNHAKTQLPPPTPTSQGGTMRRKPGHLDVSKVLRLSL